MTRKENVVDGHGNGLPFVTAAARAGHGLLVVGTFARARLNHMRCRFAMPGNRHGLAVLDRPEEFRQACLGFGRLYGTHHMFGPVNMTRWN